MQIHISEDDRTAKWQLSIGAGRRVRHIDLGKFPNGIDGAEAMAAVHLNFDPEWDRRSLTYSDVINAPDKQVVEVLANG
jgi:hypothetical protein